MHLKALHFLLFTAAIARAEFKCRNLPGDQGWPDATAWDRLNTTVEGSLIATSPLASVCHGDAYNATLCDQLRNGWLEPEQHYGHPSSIMAPFFTNGTCDPFHPRSLPCTLGNFPAFSVNVSKPDHISQSIKFATEHNIRLVIKNTGHDYLGKSTGAGALSLWTHNLKDIQLLNFQSPSYTGKALKIGAGVQGFEAYNFAHEHSLQVVGGECPSVGIAGGYTQGGGHSALASRYGLAADQTLEWEVIDGSGNFRKASRTENADLYWALSGGGGGTYGVVWSLTLKAHPDVPVSGLNLTFTNECITRDAYYEAIKSFHMNLPTLVDAGAMAVWFVTNTSFSLAPLTGPAIPVRDLVNLIDPLVSKLKQLGIEYNMHAQQFPGYLEEFTTMQAPIEVGVAQYGGRLIPRSVVLEKNDELTNICRYIVEDGGQFTGVGLNVSKAVAGDVDNAVLPAWRDTLIDTVVTTPWNFSDSTTEIVRLQKKMTNDYMARLEAISPGSGAYMNEADFRQPGFEEAFFGRNYDRLREIKRKYDPSSMFYALTAVGSNEWSVSSDGRLCPTQYTYTVK